MLISRGVTFQDGQRTTFERQKIHYTRNLEDPAEIHHLKSAGKSVPLKNSGIWGSFGTLGYHLQGICSLKTTSLRDHPNNLNYLHQIKLLTPKAMHSNFWIFLGYTVIPWEPLPGPLTVESVKV